ncbi:MAG: 5'-methylthioadenosine/adenosylhomocysteine nucleosidase [Anaeroplasmataceae bacterium]|nr:5'-methylthioadenosine/adenosylhomocysteine nucleosidase [Anaeroplasmataceae bacterium]
MIGIIAAMEEEMFLLKEALEIEEEEIICGTSFYLGKLNSQEIVLSQCGVGKVNSSIAATIMISHFCCDFILNTGIAGGITGVDTKDIVIAKSLMYYDVDAKAFGYAYGQVPGMPVQYHSSIDYIVKIKTILSKQHLSYKEAVVYSGDSFVNRKELLKNMDISIPCIAEMEGASIAQVCVKSGVDFVVLRYISDIVGKDSQIEDYKTFESEMARRSALVCLAILKNME